jgi:hypothetical protein
LSVDRRAAHGLLGRSSNLCNKIEKYLPDGAMQALFVMASAATL